jgi:hypothetical protein
MATVVAWRGTMRVWSFLPVTVSTAASGSTSPRSRANASPRRSPLAAIRLITAWTVAACSGAVIVPAACTSAAISSDEYRLSAITEFPTCRGLTIT